jgi:fructokinase
MPKTARLQTPPRLPPPAPAVSGNVVVFGETLTQAESPLATPCGAPFNITCHLAALGAKPLLVTRVGKDEAGMHLREDMHNRGLDPRGVQYDPSHPTGRIAIETRSAGPHVELPPEQAYDHIHPGMARMAGLAAKPAWIVFGTLAQRGESARALRELLAASRARAFLDLNLCDPWADRDTLVWSLQQASVVKMRRYEFNRLSRIFCPDTGQDTARARSLLQSFRLERVIVQECGRPAWTLDAQARIDSPDPTPADIHSGSDLFTAVCIIGLMRGWPLPDLLRRAGSMAGALQTQASALPADSSFYVPYLRAWKNRSDSGAQAVPTLHTGAS